MDYATEVQTKLELVRDLMAAHNLDTLWLRRVEDVLDIEVPLADEERERLRASAGAIRASLEALGIDVSAQMQPGLRRVQVGDTALLSQLQVEQQSLLQRRDRQYVVDGPEGLLDACSLRG